MTDLTKERILDAAERLFAEHGVAATSLRTIMKAAGANMAAIHYHFGSRTGLLEALMARRAEPVNRRRLEMLDDLERRHPDGPLPAGEVVRAFVGPALDMLHEPDNGHVARVMGRIIMETSEPEAVGRVFGPTARRFVAAVRRAAPHLDEDEARARLHFVVGAMVFTLNVSTPMCHASTPTEAHAALERMVDFAAAGLTAPATARSRKERS